jgi:hypothetical protein
VIGYLCHDFGRGPVAKVFEPESLKAGIEAAFTNRRAKSTDASGCASYRRSPCACPAATTTTTTTATTATTATTRRAWCSKARGPDGPSDNPTCLHIVVTAQEISDVVLERCPRPA